MDEQEKLKKTHLENYKKILIDLITNNTNALFDEDIASLIKKPPLDSMDNIKNKFLDLAKKNKIVLNTDNLNKLMADYRKMILDIVNDLKEERISKLSNCVNNFILKDKQVISLKKDDFKDINKYINKKFKDQNKASWKKSTMNINKVFNDIDDDIKNKIINDINKYVNGTYQTQLLDSIDFKILVKDTILINTFKEQGERYLFTLNNSRLFEL